MLVYTLTISRSGSKVKAVWADRRTDGLQWLMGLLLGVASHQDSYSCLPFRRLLIDVPDCPVSHKHQRVSQRLPPLPPVLKTMPCRPESRPMGDGLAAHTDRHACCSLLNDEAQFQRLLLLLESPQLKLQLNFSSISAD